MRGVIVQLFAASTLSLLNLFIGFNMAWTSYSTIYLESNTTDNLGRTLSKYETSIVGFLPMLGALMSVITAGYTSEVFGRKKTIILAALCCVLSAALIATAKSPLQLLVGKFISGLASGFHIGTAFVFVNEISQDSIRGNLSSLLIFMYNMGILLSYVCGWLFTYELINYLALTYSVLSAFLVICFLEESPVYLITKFRYKEGYKALKYYRRATNKSLLDEIIYLKKQRYYEYYETPVIDVLLLEDSINSTRRISSIRRLRNSKAALRALVTVVLLIFFTILMGPLAVQAYASHFTKAVPNVSNHLFSVTLAVANTMGSAVATAITDSVGRRVLMISSCFGCTLCTMLVATMLHWSWAPDWAIAFIVTVFCCIFQLGASNLPFVQLAESFEPEIKAFATAVGIASLYLSKFFLLALFRSVVDSFGFDVTFFVLALISLVTTLFSYLVMKETKGANFEIIHEMYESGYLYRKIKR